MSQQYRLVRSLLILVLVAGCTKPNPKSCLDNHCSDPALPFCDVDGSLGGEPNMCIAVECTPNAFEECRGDQAIACNATGDNYDLTNCEFGCSMYGCNTCTDLEVCEKRIVPKYTPTACNSLQSQPFNVDENTVFDTSGGECSDVISQTNGPEICVVRASTIAINASLTVQGTRALALVADYDIAVDGELDVSANGTQSGPGASSQVSGTNSPGQFSSSGDAARRGGGGAGYRAAGGTGGEASGTQPPTGGAAGISPVELTELFGGRTAARVPTSSAPGGAGGALTLVSCRGRVSVTGVIDAGGGGGFLGVMQDYPEYMEYGYNAPTGGGSGGTVVLQGMQVELTGRIYANGGGGGGGGIENSLGVRTSGEDGKRSMVPARGGLGYMDSFTTYGAGGAGGTSGPGLDGAPSTYGPGAGGGAGGYIVVHTAKYIVPKLTPIEVSPPIEAPQVAPTN